MRGRRNDSGCTRKTTGLCSLNGRTARYGGRVSVKPVKGRGEEEEEGEKGKQNEKEVGGRWSRLQAASGAEASSVGRLQVQGYFCSATSAPSDLVPRLHASRTG